MVDGDKLGFVLTALAVVVLPGLMTRVLSTLGYGTLGTVTWVVGYGSGIVFVWYVWIRPLEIHSPGSDGDRDGHGDR